jgi:hypothetical protein
MRQAANASPARLTDIRHNRRRRQLRKRVGQPGPPPRDIDVLVVGNPSRTDLLDVADAAQQQLHTEVNIHTTTPEAWAAKDEPFLMTVASRPLITLVGLKTAD